MKAFGAQAETGLVDHPVSTRISSLFFGGTMYRITLLFALLLMVPTMVCEAQVAEEAAHVYEAYYKIKPADLPEWNRQYFEKAVPVLDGLVSDGVIEGYNQWEHATGGEYNVRMAIRTYDWNAIDTFWDDYLSQVQAASSEGENQAVSSMIQAHRDEIWDFGTVNVPEGLETAYMYAATYQYNFADSAEWYRIWGEVVTPLVEQAMAAGHLGGWVTLDHNTGGRHNYKVLFLFDDPGP
jgi:hypothetical protein